MINIFIPLFFVLSFEVAYLFQRFYLIEAGHVSTLLLILFSIIFLIKNKKQSLNEIFDDNIQKTILLFGILLIWVVTTQIFSPRQSGYHRVGTTAIMICVLISMMFSHINPRKLLTNAGIAIGTATIISVIISGFHGKLSTDENQLFGLGAQPILGCLATPILSAWAVNIWLRKKENEELVPIQEKIFCFLSFVALFSYIILCQRRGPLLAMGAIAIVFIGMKLWKTYPRLILTCAIAGISLCGIYLLYQFNYNPGLGRSERYLLYRTAWEIGLNAFPFGQGPYGMLAAGDSGKPSEMLWIAKEKGAFHAHNELLNAWVEGGIIQVVIIIIIGLLLLQRTWRCSDPYLKMPFIALLTAWFVHVMTDNTYGIPLGMAWAGVLVGMILKLPQNDEHNRKTSVPSIKWFGICCGFLAIIIGWPAISMALLSDKTPMQKRLLNLESCRDPLFVINEVGVIVNSKEADAPMKAIAVEMAEKKVGWTLFIPRSAVAAAAEMGDYPNYIKSLVRLVERNPFEMDACLSIIDMIRQQPKYADLIPEKIVNVCGVLNGTLQVDQTIQIDQNNWYYASLHLAKIKRAIRENKLSNKDRENMLLLAQYYGRIKSVAVLAIQVLSLSDKNYAEKMITLKDYLEEGLLIPGGVTQATVLIQSQQQAVVIKPILELFYKDVFYCFDNAKLPKRMNKLIGNDFLDWRALVRIWSLTRK